MADVKKIRDIKGSNQYNPEFCQRIVEEFKPIVITLWDGCLDLREIRDHAKVFASLRESLGRSFGNALFFLAEAQHPQTSSGGGQQLFRIVVWYDPRFPEGDPQRLSPPSECQEPFHSDILEDLLNAPSKGVVYSQDLASREKGPLGRLLHNLAATRLWFYGQNTLCIGISKLHDAGEVDSWVASDARTLTYFPELLATPLRLENERLETTLFEDTCKAGIPVEVARLGERILRPRIQLAWRARAVLGSQTKSRPSKSDDERPPIVSGDYDPLLAQYLDAKRYVVARSSGAASAAAPVNPIEQFARLFDFKGPRGEQLTLFASHDPEKEPLNKEPRDDDSFALDESAVLARHAAARVKHFETPGIRIY